MSATEKSGTRSEGGFQQVADELRLQAWLAKAEQREPSDHMKEILGEAKLLATLRDELRLQGHLAAKDAGSELNRLEGKWAEVKRLAEHVAAEAATDMRSLLAEIREGYERLRRT